MDFIILLLLLRHRTKLLSPITLRPNPAHQNFLSRKYFIDRFLLMISVNEVSYVE